MNSPDSTSYKATGNGRSFVIQFDSPEVGYYLYVFDESGRCTHDYLQDTLQAAIECATELFAVPANAWLPDPPTSSDTKTS